jgi:glycerophosphoryl diester phosphodiesterase
VKRFLEGLKPTLHISHRGGALLYPENTLPAFRECVEKWRTDVLELDVHLSKDGEVVVSHDATVDRCTMGKGRVAEKTARELGELGIPRFAEVLAAFPNTRMNVELKAGDPHAFAALAKPHTARLCIGSESDPLAAELFDALPDACHFFPANAAAAYVLNGDDDARFDVLDLPCRWEGQWLFTPELKARGKWVNLWTVNDPADMQRLIAEGAGGIMTDRPDLLRALLQAG